MVQWPSNPSENSSKTSFEFVIYLYISSLILKLVYQYHVSKYLPGLTRHENPRFQTFKSPPPSQPLLSSSHFIFRPPP